MFEETWFLEQNEQILLYKILNNLLIHPDSNKYKDINLTRISSKFVNTELCIQLLQNVGFKKCHNGQRLLYSNDNSSLKLVKSLHTKLLPLTKLLPSQSRSNFLLHSTDTKKHRSMPNNPYKYAPNCLLANCPCLHAICYVLKQYNNSYSKQQMEQNKRNKTIYDDSSHNVDSIQLLNNYNHMLLEHANEFEQSYNILNAKIYNNKGKGCNLSLCLLMKRNQRNRTQITKRESLLNQMYFGNCKDISSQQLLDRIHCYFFHTFDIGYKLTKKEINEKIINKNTKQTH
eukprot:517252_1